MYSGTEELCHGLKCCLLDVVVGSRILMTSIGRLCGCCYVGQYLFFIVEWYRNHGVKALLDDDAGDFWRRVHRKGHALYKKHGGSLSELHDRAYHRWAGHLARQTSCVLRTALRTRCLAWWRFFQHPDLPLHPKRFGRPSRWEGALEKHYGVAADDNPVERDVGWMALAQDRQTWKSEEAKFAKELRCC